MNSRVYATGEIVRVDAKSLSGPSNTDEFRVAGRYRASGVSDLYRLQSMTDPSERMVPAHELTATMAFIGPRSELPASLVPFPPSYPQFLQVAA